MTRPLRIVVKTVLWVLGAMCVLVLAVVAINAFDEDVAPQTVALLKAPENPYAPDDNLYFALVGFDAPEGQSVFTVGQARVAEGEVEARKLLQDPQAFDESLKRYQNRERIDFRGKTEFCLAVTGTCWTGVETRRREISKLLQDNQELYRRYLALHALRGYFETQNSTFIGSMPFAPAQVRSLFLTNVALRIKAGTAQDRNAALIDLRNDVDTWRRVLAGNGGLLSKMVAIVNLQGDYVLLGDMIADPTVDLVPLSAQMEDILARPAADDWKLHNVLAAEFRGFAPYFFDQLRSAKGRVFPSGVALDVETPEWLEPYWISIQHYFLKVNATQNMSARSAMEIQRMMEADPRELLTAQRTLHEWNESHLGVGPSLIYNPTGKLIVGLGASPYDVYPLRVYDVAAYVRCVRLAYEIRKQRIPASDMLGFSRQHQEWSTHPVSGEPFVWDPEARELRIPTMGRPPKDRRFNIHVWTAAS